MLSADPCLNYVIALDGQSMPRAMGSNHALRLTSWPPSILWQPLAADNVSGRYAGAAL